MRASVSSRHSLGSSGSDALWLGFILNMEILYHLIFVGIDGLCNQCVFPFAFSSRRMFVCDTRTNADLPLPLFRLVREILAEKPGEGTYVSLITAGCLCSSNCVILSCHHKIMSESGEAPRCYFGGRNVEPPSFF
jgi:hypothetical protein